MRKNNPRKWGMTLIAIVSLVGSYTLYNELLFSSKKVQELGQMETPLAARQPASAPQIDHMSSSKDGLDKLMAAPRAPAQAHKLSPELIKSDFRLREIYLHGRKVKVVLDIAIVPRRKATEWGIPVKGLLHNQAVIDIQDLPQGEGFQQLIYNEKKMSYSVLTNNLKFKVKSQEDFDSIIKQFSAEIIVGEFAAIRLFIIDAKNDENANRLLEIYQTDTRLERIEREIIDQSSVPR